MLSGKNTTSGLKRVRNTAFFESFGEGQRPGRLILFLTLCRPHQNSEICRSKATDPILFSIWGTNERINPVSHPSSLAWAITKSEDTQLTGSLSLVSTWIFGKAAGPKLRLDEIISSLDDQWRATKIMCERVLVGTRVPFEKIDYILDVGTTPSVDTLIIVSDSNQTFRGSTEKIDESLLNWINVLIFVHKNVAKRASNIEDVEVVLFELVNNQANHEREIVVVGHVQGITDSIKNFT